MVYPFFIVVTKLELMHCYNILAKRKSYKERVKHEE